MKFTIERDALLKAIGFVQGAVEKKGLVPILSAIRLEAATGAVSAAGTDLDFMALASAPCPDIASPGAVAVAADTLVGFVRKCPANAPVTLALDKDARLIVTAGRARCAFPTWPAEDFPAWPPLEAPARFTIDAGALRRLIEKTRYAISNQETRYYLNGLFLRRRGGADGYMLIGVATDGHRLAYAEAPMTDAAGDMPDVIVPRQALGEVRKLIAEHEGPVEVETSASMIRFAAGDAIIASKLIDGAFPEYERVIPKANPFTVKAPRAALAEALGRVLIVSDSDSRSVRFAAAGEACALTARHPDRGEARDELPAEADADIEVGFNGRYLAEVLSHGEGEEVVFRLADPAAPVRIEDPGDAHAFAVLMPLRVA